MMRWLRRRFCDCPSSPLIDGVDSVAVQQAIREGHPVPLADALAAIAATYGDSPDIVIEAVVIPPTR